MKITKLNEWASINKSLSVVGKRGDSSKDDDVSIVFFHVELVDEFESFSFFRLPFSFIRTISSVFITNLSNPSFKFHESFKKNELPI